MSVGTDATGTFTHDSNTLTVGTLTIGDSGTYNMTGGTLAASSTVVTEFGTFHQSGGTASVGEFSGELGGMTIDSGATATATALTGEMGHFAINGTLTVSHTTATRQAPGVAMDLDSIAVGSGGKFDITNHDIVEHPTPYNGGMFLADVRAALIAGRGTGTWDGSTGITSSDAHANGMDLGYASALELGLPDDGSGSFEGIGILQDDLDDNSTYDVIIKYTFGGDANLDGKVDSADQAILTSYMGTSSGADWSMGDFNYDGVVNSADQAILTADWLDGTGGIHGAPVPEPAALGIIGIPAFVMLSRRYRRSH
ncbi:MAG TPA: dockerin type I repeat-containing protein [Phycisphaerae bacterium]|nr:dockerin type I repeat-containing protein [Phycisphaerae bacterium]